MKTALVLLLLHSLTLPAFAADSPPAPTSAPAVASTPLDPFDQIKQMGRGVNILGYDPLWSNAATARFKEKHFATIHDGGFQTVRVNLQAIRHMNDANQLDATWFSTLDWVIKNALANHLTVILDEHDYNPLSTDLAINKPKLLAFWQQVGERYKNQPNTVVFEMLNEPHAQLDAPAWNALLAECLPIIRNTNPTRNVIIGPASWNSLHFLNKLDLPADDHHLITTIHYYTPMTFTHQGARWSPETANLSGITWGTDADKKVVQADFATAQSWSVAHHRPILLGEFGSYDKGDMDSRASYTSSVARTAESLNWAWTYWQFDSDFIVYNIKKDEWVRPIWKALVPSVE